MLDGWARRVIDPGLNRAGGILAARGVSADGVTRTGLALGLAAAGLVAVGHMGWLALILPLFRQPHWDD